MDCSAVISLFILNAADIPLPATVTKLHSELASALVDALAEFTPERYIFVAVDCSAAGKFQLPINTCMAS
jgi:hypothetical protein